MSMACGGTEGGQCGWNGLGELERESGVRSCKVSEAMAERMGLVGSARKGRALSPCLLCWLGTYPAPCCPSNVGSWPPRVVPAWW